MIINEIYDEVSKTEDSEIVLTKDIEGNNSLKKYEQVISLKTELSLQDGLKDIQLYIALQKPYSVHIPKIYIDEESYNQIKYLPHVNEDLSICIFDDNENFYFETDYLPQITLKLISQSKKILRKKDDDNYLKEEFEREFFAYWNVNYNENESFQDLGLCLINFNDFKNIKAIKFKNKFAHYDYLVYNDEYKFKLFEKYLNLNKIKYYEISVFIAEYNNIFPPHRINYEDSLKYLQDLKGFKSSVNKFHSSEFIIVFKGNKNELFGWYYSLSSKKIKGLRSKTNWQLLNSKLLKNSLVNRFSFSNISPKRLDERTAGKEIERNLKIAIIGLGSVGSNLLHYLMKYPISKYCLIDPDILKVENVYRNKFGFNYISNFKSKISEYEILCKNPFTQVISYQKNIYEVFKKSQSIIEDYNFRFIVLGISRIEKFIIQHLISINSTKPLILIWVEPYLASGQMIYLNPSDFKKGLELLNNYPYHVIEKREKLFLIEGSCQTGYMPYSDINLSLFLSNVNLILHEILIENKTNKSRVFSWVGDIEMIKKKGIKSSGIYNLDDKYKLFDYDI